MRRTKNKILDTARALFNELGYSQVTIRMIASELGMSSGNLNYHFRKREDILEALYFEMVEVFDKRIEELEGQTISLAYMKINVEQSIERMIVYRFFWTDLYNLLKSNEKIKTHFDAAKKERVNGYDFLFKYFIAQDIMQAPSFQEEYVLLIERMINYSNTCLYASSLYEKELENDTGIEQTSFQLLLMMYPYLTDLGKKEFHNLYPFSS